MTILFLSNSSNWAQRNFYSLHNYEIKKFVDSGEFQESKFNSNYEKIEFSIDSAENKWKKRVAFSAGFGMKYSFSKPKYFSRKLYEISTAGMMSFGIYLSRKENSLIGVEVSFFKIEPNQNLGGESIVFTSGFFRQNFQIWEKISILSQLNISVGNDHAYIPSLGIDLGVEYVTDYFNFFVKNKFNLYTLFDNNASTSLPQILTIGTTFKL